MKLSEIAIKVTNRNRKVVIGWLESINKPPTSKSSAILSKDCFIIFRDYGKNGWISVYNTHASCNVVTLSQAKAIYEKENRPQPTHEQLKSERGRSAMYKMKYKQAKSSCHRLNEMLGEANEGKQQMVIANGKTIKELDLYKERVVELEEECNTFVKQNSDLIDKLKQSEGKLKRLHSELLDSEHGSDKIIETLKDRIENQTNFSNDLIEERDGLYASFTKLDRSNSELQDANTTISNQLSKTKKQRDTAFLLMILIIVSMFLIYSIR